MSNLAYIHRGAETSEGSAGPPWGDRRPAGPGQASGPLYTAYGDETGRRDDADPSADRQAVSSPSRRAARGRAPATATAPTTLAQRDLVRRTVQKAIAHADDMIRAAEVAEPIDLSNAGFDLWRCLKDLWAMRKHREPNWGDLLNTLQGALAGETFETFDPGRCLLIRRILADHLKPWTVEDEDVGTAIDLISRAGLDPWKGISAA